MDNHVCRVRNRAFCALGQRIGKYTGLPYVIEICDRGYLGQPYLQQIEAFHPIGPRVVVKYGGVGDDSVLTHRAVSRYLLLDVKSGAGKRTLRQKLGGIYDWGVLQIAGP